MLNFRIFFESNNSQALLQTIKTSPNKDLLYILADAVEEDGNLNSAIIRDPNLFDKKFINWWGKYMFLRSDGQKRQLALPETRQLKIDLPVIKDQILSGHPHELKEPFFTFLTKLVNGDRV